MNKNLRILLASFLTSTLLFTGCSSEKEKEKNNSNPKVAAVLMALNSDYWHMIETGINKSASELGLNVKVVGPTSESDVTGQIAMIEDQISAGAKGIILAPSEAKAVIPVLEKAKEKGIPIVTIDADLPEKNQNLRATFVGTSEYEAGQVVAKYVIANFKPCEVAIIRGIAGNPNHTFREKGFSELIQSSGFKVVTVQPADSERGKAVGVTENILESSPNVKIIYATNDEMALGAYQAVEAKKLQNDLFIIGFDGSPDALKSIKDGKLDATIAQMPINMGSAALNALNSVLKGDKVENRISTPTVLVDSKNVEKFENDLNAQMKQVGK